MNAKADAVQQMRERPVIWTPMNAHRPIRKHGSALRDLKQTSGDARAPVFRVHGKRQHEEMAREEPERSDRVAGDNAIDAGYGGDDIPKLTGIGGLALKAQPLDLRDRRQIRGVRIAHKNSHPLVSAANKKAVPSSWLPCIEL